MWKQDGGHFRRLHQGGVLQTEYWVASRDAIAAELK